MSPFCSLVYSWIDNEISLFYKNKEVLNFILLASSDNDKHMLMSQKIMWKGFTFKLENDYSPN